MLLLPLGLRDVMLPDAVLLLVALSKVDGGMRVGGPAALANERLRTKTRGAMRRDNMSCL